jgi:ketosteroid isomerase-like protein
MVIIACQQTPKTVPVNVEAEKAAISVLFDMLMAAYDAGDAAALVTFFTEDGSFCGTDPSEFMNKQEIKDAFPLS